MRILKKRVLDLEMACVLVDGEVTVDHSAMTAAERQAFDNAARRYHAVGPREMTDCELRAIFDAPRIYERQVA